MVIRRSFRLLSHPCVDHFPNRLKHFAVSILGTVTALFEARDTIFIPLPGR